MNTLVNFELAKLLKEREFDKRAEKRYGTRSGILYNDALINDLEDDVFTAAPTIAEVVMWLYEKYGIWIWVRPYKDHAADNNEPYYAQMNVWKMGVTVSKEFKSPKEAYQEAIKYTLTNLL